MKLSIIIVNYNTRELLKDCINSVVKSIKDISYEIIVVDNNSADGSVDMVKTFFADTRLITRLICNDFNAGFAKANNQGYMISKGEYILLLNSDTVVLDNAIDRLVDFLDNHADAAVVGPRLLNSDMTLQLPCRRGFPRLVNSIAYFSKLSRLFPKSKLFGSYLMTYMDSSVSHQVDAVSGACLLVRRERIEASGGLLDESFFMHFEDIDLCYRIKKAGYNVYYVHDARVIHLKGQSSKLRSMGVLKNFFNSALIYFKKNYKQENIIAYFILVFMIKCMKLLAIGRQKLVGGR